MPERKLTYQEYRVLKLQEAEGDEEVQQDPFYLDPEEKPETDALMQQYSQMQEQLLQIKPQSPEYQEQLQAMTDVMDQLMQLNPNDAVRGEEQRLRRLTEPATQMTEAEAYEEPPEADWGDEAYTDEYFQPDASPGDGYNDATDQVNSPSMDISQYPRYAAAETMNDADPEDQQAHDDLVELAGVYGLKLGGLKNPRPARSSSASARRVWRITGHRRSMTISRRWRGSSRT
jgi:hypothetical protein